VASGRHKQLDLVFPVTLPMYYHRHGELFRQPNDQGIAAGIPPTGASNLGLRRTGRAGRGHGSRGGDGAPRLRRCQASNGDG
jgi:hypothetical protein